MRETRSAGAVARTGVWSPRPAERPTQGSAALDARDPGWSPTIRHAADDLPEQDRLAILRQTIGRSLIDLDLKPDPREPFSGVIAARPCFDLRLLKMTTTPADLVRTPTGDDGCDCVLLHVNVSGTAVVSSRRRDLALHDGEAVLLDGGDPFRIARQSTGQSFTVRVPRSRLSGPAALIGRCIMRRLPNAAGVLNLFTAYLDALLHHGDSTSPLVHRLTYRHVTDLMAILLDPHDPVRSDVTDPGDVAAGLPRSMPTVRLRAAKAYVGEHLREGLSIGKVAVELGVSERYLQRLFARNGTTFTAFVNDIRLNRIRAMLCDPGNDMIRIRALAFKVGFRDVSHFNRLFRARYGCTPADMRKNATLGPGAAGDGR